jgi:hypothetical protein
MYQQHFHVCIFNFTYMQLQYFSMHLDRGYAASCLYKDLTIMKQESTYSKKTTKVFVLSLELAPPPIPLSANTLIMATSLLVLVLSLWQEEALPILTKRQQYYVSYTFVVGCLGAAM